LFGFDQKASAVGDPWRCFHVLTRCRLDGESCANRC
jgi:hypothetical protein